MNEMRGKAAGSEQRPFRSRDQVFIAHVDDKSSIDDHSVPKQGSGVLNRYARGCCGFTDYVYEAGTMILMDSTKAQKDTDVVINEVIFSILRSVNGEKPRAGGSRRGAPRRRRT